MKTLFVRTLVALVVIAGILSAILFARAAFLDAPPPPEGEPHPFAFDEGGAPERLAAALRIPTVSAIDPEAPEGDARDDEAWLRFHRHLEESFPLVHERLGVETVSDLSLLYTWEGTDAQARPVLLAAHMDVVGVEEASVDEWTHPPFSGTIVDGHIWGRGALDMKGPLMAMMEAVEGLLADGFQPRRTILLGFGHDEELGGLDGALRIAGRLEERGTAPEWVLDEGGALTSGVIGGINDPVGLVGTAEKGYLTVEILAEDVGGHSGIPGEATAAGSVSRAVARLEEQRFPPRLEGPARELLLTVAPHMDPGTRMLAANLWLLDGVVARAYAAEPLTATLVQTTTAPTVLRAGLRENVLPTEATALVNFRLAPWDSIEGVLGAVRERVADLDVRVTVRDEEVSAFAPSSVSSTAGAGYGLLRESIHRVFPDVLTVAPFLMFGATDARHYDGVADDVYRFAPFRADESLLERVHGIDERIAVPEYVGMVRFYAELLRGAGAGS